MLVAVLWKVISASARSIVGENLKPLVAERGLPRYEGKLRRNSSSGVSKYFTASYNDHSQIMPVHAKTR